MTKSFKFVVRRKVDDCDFIHKTTRKKYNIISWLLWSYKRNNHSLNRQSRNNNNKNYVIELDSVSVYILFHAFFSFSLLSSRFQTIITMIRSGWLCDLAFVWKENLKHFWSSLKKIKSLHNDMIFDHQKCLSRCEMSRRLISWLVNSTHLTSNVAHSLHPLPHVVESLYSSLKTLIRHLNLIVTITITLMALIGTKRHSKTDFMTLIVIWWKVSISQVFYYLFILINFDILLLQLHILNISRESVWSDLVSLLFDV